MLFYTGLYLSLAVCAAGVAWRLWRWLSLKIGPEAQPFTPGQRAWHLLRGGGQALFSKKLPAMIWAYVVDGLLQRRAWRVSRLGWLAHMFIYTGFTLLVLLHAMDGLITRPIFSGYEPSLNPWLFLRDLMGVMVLVGAGLAIWRRVHEPGRRRTARPLDHIIIALVAVIIVSGFVAKGFMISSPDEFHGMVEEFSLYQEPEEVEKLAAWWAAEYGVSFEKTPPMDAASLATGREYSAESCVDCHSRPQWAFASYGISRLAAPAAPRLASVDASGLLIDLHFFLAFIALALTPFTKFFHMLASPILLMARAAADPATIHPANLATLRAMELDACMHCTTCSVHCSVAAATHDMPGRSLLPSEKLAGLAHLAEGKELPAEELGELWVGNEICTRCQRCTRLCPAGINLQDLWEALSADLAARGLAEPHAAARETMHAAAVALKQDTVWMEPQARPWLGHLSTQAQTFSNCFGCLTCTTVCPVVKLFPEPAEHLDLTPNQVMRCLGLGLYQEALGARMVWDCLNCYRCQEACPQGVKVADVMAELRNAASMQLRHQNKETA